MTVCTSQGVYRTASVEIGITVSVCAFVPDRYQQLRLQKRRLIRWLQDKAAELSQEDLAGVQDVMLADTQQLDRAVW